MHRSCPQVGPMVGGEDHIGIGTEQVDRLGQILRPRVRITHQCTADGENVVQSVAGVLGQAQDPQIGEEEVELWGRLRARRHLKHHPDTVDRELLARGGHVDRGRDQRELTRRGGLRQARPHLPLRAAVQGSPVHVSQHAGSWRYRRTHSQQRHAP